MRRILLLVLALCAYPSFASAKPMNDQQLASMAKAIRLFGFVCDKANDGRLYERSNRGPVFRIVCNRDTFVYRVTITTDKNLIIKPW